MAADTLTASEGRELIRRTCKAESNQSRWALKRGICPSVMTDILRGITGPTPQVMAELGYRKVGYRTKTAVYEKVNRSNYSTINLRNAYGLAGLVDKENGGESSGREVCRDAAFAY